MTSGAERQVHEEIRLVVNRINEAWLNGRPEDVRGVMSECFRDDMVMRGPDFQRVAVGREACVRSYEEFLRDAKVRECTLSEPEIDVTVDTAVATYSWTMTYELNGQEYRETGYDLFVFTRDEGRWRAAWRAMLPSPR